MAAQYRKESRDSQVVGPIDAGHTFGVGAAPTKVSRLLELEQEQRRQGINKMNSAGLPAGVFVNKGQ